MDIFGFALYLDGIFVSHGVGMGTIGESQETFNLKCHI